MSRSTTVQFYVSEEDSEDMVNEQTRGRSGTENLLPTDEREVELVKPLLTTAPSITKPSRPMLSHNTKRLLSTILLIVQNSTLILTLGYSSELPKPRPNPRVVVFCWEVAKIVVASLFLLAEGNAGAQISKCLRQWPETFKMLVPAALYLFQNNAAFYAIKNLNAAVFQVTYQTKILTTAGFHVLMLGRMQTSRQVQALVLLVFGVSLVQLSRLKPDVETDSSGEERNFGLGLVAVGLSCCSSGFAGVYFEMVLKTTDTGMWMRNVQLAFWSAVLAPISMWQYRESLLRDGFFVGFDWTTTAIICLQVIGGFTVALVVKFADSVAKGFATSVSIVLSTLISAMFLDFDPTLSFMAGAGCVVLATNLYSRGSKKPEKSRS